MIWVFALGVAVLVVACGDDAAVDEGESSAPGSEEIPNDEGTEPGESQPLGAVVVCPDREDESCLDFAATKDDRFIARNINRYNRITKQAERRIDLFDRENDAVVLESADHADSLFHRLQLLWDGSALALFSYRSEAIVQHLLPEEYETHFPDASFQGVRISADGRWASVDDGSRTTIVDLAEERDMRELPEETTIADIANDGTILASTLTLVDREEWRFEQRFLTTRVDDDQEATLAAGRRSGCGNTQGISNDGSTIVLASGCDPLLVAHHENGEYVVREVAIPFAGRRSIGLRDMSENGRTICFDAPGDYYLYDRVADAWHSLRERFPLALNPKHNLTVACQVASQDGVHGALYFADAEGDLYTISRAELSEIIGE